MINFCKLLSICSFTKPLQVLLYVGKTLFLIKSPLKHQTTFKDLIYSLILQRMERGEGILCIAEAI